VNSLSRCFLYGILDLGYVPPDKVAPVTAQLLQGGVDLLQLRAKKDPKTEILKYAEAMLPLTKAAGVPLILNDYPELLREIDADGCHVGQEDFGVAEARDLAGRDCLVGKSTHMLAQAQAAEREGADYIGFGPFWRREIGKPPRNSPRGRQAGLHCFGSTSRLGCREADSRGQVDAFRN
jgi:thiamine-phosphate pyrophosphorylase